jgi:hypothetical protein
MLVGPGPQSVISQKIVLVKNKVVKNFTDAET